METAVAEVLKTTANALPAGEEGHKPLRVGTGLPGPGRPRGVPTKLTRTIKEAIELACAPGACHPQGLAGWLIERAQGSVEDRKIFAGLVGKVIPAQLQASIDGNVVVQLPWLTNRNIRGRVPSTSQLEAVDAQVIDVTMEKGGDLRVSDPRPALAAEIPDPLPPIERQAGGGEEKGFP
jgi:hypothetical protein